MCRCADGAYSGTMGSGPQVLGSPLKGSNTDALAHLHVPLVAAAAATSTASSAQRVNVVSCIAQTKGLLQHCHKIVCRVGVGLLAREKTTSF